VTWNINTLTKVIHGCSRSRSKRSRRGWRAVTRTATCYGYVAVVLRFRNEGSSMFYMLCCGVAV
jgi:hypothetical protein